MLKPGPDSLLAFQQLNPIPHWVFWITHSVISTDMDLQFGMLKKPLIFFSKL